MPLRYHEGTVVNDVGEELHYKGHRPSANDMLNLVSIHMRNLARDAAGEQEEGAGGELERTSDMKRQMETELASIVEINGTPSGEHDRADVALCYSDLMAFFGGEASLDSEQNSPDSS